MSDLLASVADKKLSASFVFVSCKSKQDLCVAEASPAAKEPRDLNLSN